MKKILLLLFITISFQSIAQNNKGCNFYGENALYTQKDICDYLNNFNSNGDAEEIIDDILTQVGLKRNFVIIECKNYENASAVNYLNKNNELIRYLIYGSEFLNRLNSKTKDWGAYSILAHEIGHHLNGHTLSKGGSKPPTELEADEFSGFVLNKLGATLEEAQEVFKIGGSEKASSTHPARKDRLFAVEQGWNSANALTSINTVVRVDTVIVNNTIIEEKIVTKTDTLVFSKKDTVVIFEKDEIKNLKTKLQIGLDFGSLNVYGDVRTKYFWNAIKPLNTLATSISVLVPLHKNIAFLKLGFLYGNASGFNYQGATGYWHKTNNPWDLAGYSGAGSTPKKVYYNYKTTISHFSADLVLKSTKFNKLIPFISLGGGMFFYNTMVDAKNASNTMYDFNAINNATGSNSKVVNKTLKSLFDGNYESQGERENIKKEYVSSGILNLGFGLELKLNKKLSLVLSNRYSLTGEDLIDGQKWQENQRDTNGTLVSSPMTRDSDNINFTSLGFIYSFNKKH